MPASKLASDSASGRRLPERPFRLTWWVILSQVRSPVEAGWYDDGRLPTQVSNSPGRPEDRGLGVTLQPQTA